MSIQWVKCRGCACYFQGVRWVEPQLCNRCKKKPVDPSGVFRTVVFPSAHFATGSIKVYRTMERANIGRIYARALANVPKTNKHSTTGWADLARAIGMITPIKTETRLLYRLATTGRLPDDPQQRKRLFKIAGYPWK